MSQVRLLIIYTGGTIGMRSDLQTGALKPFDFPSLAQEVSELQRLDVDLHVHSFDPAIDSADIAPEHWLRIAHLIHDHYDRYDGFVVLHGTDTMAYTASAVSFLLENLNKPVIFTGSQVPVGALRTDAKENLISAIQIAADRWGEEPVLGEVCIYFQNRLFRANRTTKFNTDQFNAFRSENYPALAEAGIQIRYNLPYLRKKDPNPAPLTLSEHLSSDVLLVHLFPGLAPHTLRTLLCAEGVRGVVLRTYGSGNAPTNEAFLSPIRQAIERGVLVLNITQCAAGSVDMNIYETGRKLLSMGVLSGYDITMEAALTKMMYLLGRPLSDAERVAQLSSSIRGEVSIHPTH